MGSKHDDVEELVVTDYKVCCGIWLTVNLMVAFVMRIQRSTNAAALLSDVASYVGIG